MATTQLMAVSKARQWLAKATDIDDVLDVRDKAAAVAQYRKTAGESREAANEAAEIKVRAERRAGELLREMKSNGSLATRGKPKTGQDVQFTAVDVLGGDDESARKESQRLQQAAEAPAEVFEEYIETQKESPSGEITSVGVRNLAKNPHVAKNTGVQEWYTPEEYIEAVRDVMGEIDLDPASSKVANQCVKARKFFTAEDDGLSKNWRADTLYCNPPYSNPEVGEFLQKIVAHYEAGDVKQAIVLVNNSTDTKWWQAAAEGCELVCFTNHRIKYSSPQGEKGSPIQGQTFLYYGRRKKKFSSVFGQLGIVMRPFFGE